MSIKRMNSSVIEKIRGNIQFKYGKYEIWGQVLIFDILYLVYNFGNM